MKKTQIFSGSSHPELVDSICKRLGIKPGKADLGKFSNGETRVSLDTSTRDQDVFVVQSGGDKVNDDLVELLIMCSACQSGSAKTITAVMPYFPYSRQSKKKAHRGAIVARMVANLLETAGVTHVITIDLHHSQMQGFFRCTIDNLPADTLNANWIRANIRDWHEAVVVSKNPGGTKRTTALADLLGIGFGLITTDRKRGGSNKTSVAASMVFDPPKPDGHLDGHDDQEETFSPTRLRSERVNGTHGRYLTPAGTSATLIRPRADTAGSPRPSSSRMNSASVADNSLSLARIQTAPSALRESEAEESEDEEEDDISAGDSGTRDIVTGRLVNGRIVDDDYPSPSISPTSTNDETADPMLASTISHMSLASVQSARTLNGNNRYQRFGHNQAEEGNASEDEEDQLKNPTLESTVTLIGSVRKRPVFIIDDMIDKSASWIAAAETVVKRGGATKVYCIATHGVFGNDCLKEMEECDCISEIIVTNSIPLEPEQLAMSSKLRVHDVSGLLAEAIRRTKNGESNDRLYADYE